MSDQLPRQIALLDYCQVVYPILVSHISNFLDSEQPREEVLDLEKATEQWISHVIDIGGEIRMIYNDEPL